MVKTKKENKENAKQEVRKNVNTVRLRQQVDLNNQAISAGACIDYDIYITAG